MNRRFCELSILWTEGFVKCWYWHTGNLIKVLRTLIPWSIAYFDVVNIIDRELVSTSVWHSKLSLIVHWLWVDMSCGCGDVLAQPATPGWHVVWLLWCPVPASNSGLICRMAAVMSCPPASNSGLTCRVAAVMSYPRQLPLLCNKPLCNFIHRFTQLKHH